MFQNLKNIRIVETLRVNALRGFSTGIVFMLLSFFLGGTDAPFYQRLLWPFFFPVILLILFPVPYVLKMFNLQGVGNIMCMLFSVPGDPLVYLLSQIHPQWVPVQDYKVFCFSAYIYVSEDTNPAAKGKNQTTLSETIIYDGYTSQKPIGRLISDGAVYTGTFGGDYLGKVENRFVYGISGTMILGRIEENGEIITGSFGGEHVGYVDREGMIYAHTLSGKGSILGQAKGPKVYEAAAAYLLLFHMEH